jgi:hypothetical protein
MPAKKVVVALLIIVVAIGGFVAGLVLLREKQDISEKAAVPGGQARVSLSPATGNYNVGDTISMNVSFNPSNIAVSGVAVRLTYPFSGVSPEVSVSSITVNSSFLSSGDWTCPTQNSSLQGGNVIIDVACANTSAAGFTSGNDTLLAAIEFKVDRAPATSPVIVRFDPALSIITRKSDNQDTLLIPEGTGTYTIAGAGTQITTTPVPTTKLSGTPVPTKKLTATPKPTATPKLTATPGSTSLSPTEMPKGGLPEAGVSFPTILGIGVGALVIVGAVLLAL